MLLKYFKFDDLGHEKSLAYWCSGDPDSKRTLVCVHGLLRHSRDFDEMSAAINPGYFVLAIDLPGRGLSDPLNQAEDYNPQNYAKIIKELLLHLNRSNVHWLGTSLGGLVGMLLAAEPKSLIGQLVLNDIGAELPQQALARIADYASPPEFSTLAEVEFYLRDTYKSFQGLTDKQWYRLADYGSRELEKGGYTLHYDPKIAFNTRLHSNSTIELWSLWKMINQPCLVIHGLESDLLTTDITQRMRETHPLMELFTINGVGHAPSLMTGEQIEPIVNFLRRGAV